jgi:hypothetical protein
MVLADIRFCLGEARTLRGTYEGINVKKKKEKEKERDRVKI